MLLTTLNVGLQFMVKFYIIQFLIPFIILKNSKGNQSTSQLHHALVRKELAF